MSYYEYRHRVGFEETNLVGNVYYVNHLRWQGRCREMFLLEHAPEILDDLARGLALATVRCSCDYLAELRPFDEVALRMRLAAVAQNRITLHFEYWRCSAGSPGSPGPQGSPGGEELVARGEQQVACMRREGDSTVPVAIPAALREALRPYAGPEIVL